jgi:biotin carboxylase
MHKKSILIFGAGLNQLELIREAKKLNLTSVAIDPAIDPPGKAECDFYYQVRSDDYNTTREIATRHKIDGIVTGQMENPLKLMAKLAEEMGYIFHSCQVAAQCRDKWLMKEAFSKNSVPYAKGILLKSGEESLSELPGNLTFPLIIKPRDSYSSRGVYKTNSMFELERYLYESRSFSSNRDVIIEEFLRGKEYSVESVTHKGVTSVIQYTEKFITPYPNTVEVGHIQPAELDESQKNIIKALVVDAINSLGIDNSATHTEVMLNDDRAWIIEVGARLGGDFIASYLTKASTGISMDRAAIQIALGLPPDINQTCQYCSMIKYVNFPPGKRIHKIIPIDHINQLPGLVLYHLYVKEGDITESITHSGKRAGFVIVRGDHRKTVMELAETYSEIIKNNVILN